MLRLINICKSYKCGKDREVVLDNINVNFKKNELVFILGSSGSGKSTLLNIIGGIDTKSSGNIEMNSDVKIGYMLQNDCLFPWINILDNCLLGLKINGDYNDDNVKYVLNLLEMYGLKDDSFMGILKGYFSWLSSLLHFDLGTSFVYARPVSEVIFEHMGISCFVSVAVVNENHVAVARITPLNNLDSAAS